MPAKGATPIDYAEALGEAYLSFAKHNHRKNVGHYLTPASIARFMAGCSSYSERHMRVLDPGSGTGILSAAVCEAASEGGTVKNLHVDAYETEPLLADLTRLLLAFSQTWLGQRGVALTFDVRHGDFVLEYASALEAASKANGYGGDDRSRSGYGLVISNPPYFKIGKDDPRAVAWASVVHGQPNIYALFMAISAELLSETGKLVYIVPRSFASGPYFRRFREGFFRRVVPAAIHLFESRKDVFKNQTVLQENLIFTGRRRRERESVYESQVVVSHSRTADDLATRRRLMVGLDAVLDPASENNELFIPACKQDLELVQAVRTWPNTLSSLGLEISTGPVVPFRATSFLMPDANGASRVPLLWMQHVRPMRTDWPSAGASKPQWIAITDESMKLLVEDATYVLLRRFSAKEEKRRLVAAPLIRGSLNAHVVGLENHLNYIRGVSRELDEELAYGLSALLNSTFLDRYFRISNGNTQVSATELRAMPLPAERDIRTIGAEVHARLDAGPELLGLDGLVAGTLDLSPELRMEARARGEMSKIDDARDILEQMGLPLAQRNDISCLTLLALASLSEDDAWSQASKPSLTIHQIIGFMRDVYEREYAENTRETVRRQVIHQFEQARVVDRNPDEPDLPTNSPRTHYGLTGDALKVLRLYETGGWESALHAFRSSYGTLMKMYQRERRMREIPIRTLAGEEIRLSPGRHNRLQGQVVTDFGPRFAPGSTLLYLGDAANKLLYLDKDKLAHLGVPITEHGKLPDVVIYDEERNWLFLVEAVTSHGPVTPKRVKELEVTLKDCAATRLYVSAFPDFRQFKQHVEKIAWETEVWIAEIPDHLIHFNGDKFLGPS